MANNVEEKKRRIYELFQEAENRLEEARVLSTQVRGWFPFTGLPRGAGAELQDGEWVPSSTTC